jgi:hypothetical protein
MWLRVRFSRRKGVEMRQFRSSVEVSQRSLEQDNARCRIKAPGCFITKQVNEIMAVRFFDVVSRLTGAGLSQLL